MQAYVIFPAPILKIKIRLIGHLHLNPGWLTGTECNLENSQFTFTGLGEEEFKVKTDLPPNQGRELQMTWETFHIKLFLQADTTLLPAPEISIT